MSTTINTVNPRRLALATLIAAALVETTSPTLAVAQSVLEEIVVTARKRAESLQETPVAVSAFSGDALSELGMTTIADLTKVVPNVDMYTGNGATGAGNVFIRGVGQRNIGVNYDSGVGIYVDGVYASRADGAVLDNVDIQSVQVLRGPQGTLFGKNTTGGAILYNTNKPSEEFGGNVQVRAGNYDQLDGKATVNIPLVGDTLLSRFSVYSTNRDGFVDVKSNGNAFMLDGEEFSDVERYGGQAQFRWVASDDLLLDLNYMYNKTDQAPRGQNCEVVEGIPGAGWQALLQDSTVIEPSTGKTIKEWCRENQNLGKDDVQANIDPANYEAEVNTLALTAEWDVNDNMAFKSISAWRNTEAGQVDEIDAMGIPLLDRTNYRWQGTDLRETDAYSQEFQLSGTAFNDRLEYVVGAFGFTEENDKNSRASPTGPFFNTSGFPQLAFYTNQNTELLAKNSSVSFFSQTDWAFNDAWNLTLGIRYTWEERELARNTRIPDIETLSTTENEPFVVATSTYFFPDGADSFNRDHLFVFEDDPDNPGQPDPLSRQKMKTDDSDITPMASLQYSFEEAGFINLGTAYFTVANGYMSGGISDTVEVETRRIYEYDPEEVWNYELGLKFDAWDRRLRVNTALFYTDYQDRQLTTLRINPDTGRIAGALINADSSTIAGLEIETTILPIENLQITANVTINDGDIDEYDDQRILAAAPGPVPENCVRVNVAGNDLDACEIDRSDENLPRLPEEIYFLAAQYNWTTGFGMVIPMISWSYRTNVDNCFDRASCLSGLYEVDQEDVSARLTWLSTDQKWRVTAYGNNLTDDRYITGGTPLVDVAETAGTVYNLPRTYGVEASYTW
jgi:iron complex outermembrane receptor protein